VKRTLLFVTALCLLVLAATACSRGTASGDRTNPTASAALSLATTPTPEATDDVWSATPTPITTAPTAGSATPTAEATPDASATPSATVQVTGTPTSAPVSTPRPAATATVKPTQRPATPAPTAQPPAPPTAKPTATPTATPSSAPSAASFESEVLRLVNIERANAGLPALTWHSGAAAVARAHSTDMGTRNYFSHTNPEGQSSSARVTAAGIGWSACGENIANGYITPAEVVEGWMNSPGHRANILGNYTHIGVGFFIQPGTSYGTYWTQVFLTPR